MTSQLESSALVPKCGRKMVRLTSAGVMMLGVLVLVGWFFEISLLVTGFPGLVPMMVNTAICFILLGLALSRSSLAATSRDRILARLACAAVIVIAAATFLEDALDRSFGIDELLINDSYVLEGIRQRPGRMSPPTAIGLVMMSIAMLMLPLRSVWVRRLTQGFVLTTLLMSGLALMVYAYGVRLLYLVEPCISMALPTALGFWGVGIGVLYCRDDFHVMAPIRSRRLGGVVARTLLPAVVGVPLMSGWVLFQCERMGVFQIEAGMAINACAMIVAFGVLVWYCAETLNRADEQRERACRAEGEFRALSGLDPLTNLCNRRRFWEQLEAEWHRSRRYTRPLSCIMLDLDSFKSINDNYGHLAGDDVLRALSMTLKRESRPSDLVCRYGGEEFCIMLPEASEPDAYRVAERLRRILAETPIDIGGQYLRITGSFGVAECGGPEEVVDTFINRADRALLVAKKMGRNCVVAASSLEPSPGEPQGELAVATS